MPQLDKTGPMGLGSQTGKKHGQCNKSDNDVVEFTARGRRRNRVGFGFLNKVNNENDIDREFGNGFRKGRGSYRGRIGRNK